MRPFNLIESLNGASVCTANGRDIVEIHRFLTASPQRVYGVTQYGSVLSWDDDGIYGLNDEQKEEHAGYDLRMKS